MKMKKLFAVLAAGLLLAGCLAGCGGSSNESAYADLTIMPGVELGVEEYGIAFRKGSDMVAKVDAISAELFKDGTMDRIAEKYEQKDNMVKTFVASTDSNPAGASDWEYIKNKGKMIVGVTDYAPMDYQDANGKWIGFDAEYAEAVGKKLGVAIEFLEIDWDTKALALENKVIDCVWNGMTITEEMLNAADVSGAYMKNYQVVVVKDAETYTSLESLKGKVVVAEAGSAGEKAAKADANLSVGYKEVPAMADALLQVKSGAADACVIDFIMAESLVGK